MLGLYRLGCNTSPNSDLLNITVETEAPEIYAVTGSGLILEPLTTSGSSTHIGTISFQDLQFEDPNITISALTQTISPLPGVSVANLGSFVAGVGDTSNDDGLGTLEWTYSVNNSAINFLAAGQQLQRTFLVTLADPNNSGKADQYVVTVTINGTNDAPVVSAISTTNLIEQTNQSPITASITISFTDADLIDVVIPPVLPRSLLPESQLGLH